jgi:hypothetical protein
VKIALFHDYFGAIGAGGNVVIPMAKIPDADILTTDGLKNSSLNIVAYAGCKSLCPVSGITIFKQMKPIR